jgi:hypothetical protein
VTTPFGDFGTPASSEFDEFGEGADDRRLQAARESVEGRWAIREIHGGFIAVPWYTTIIASTTLDGLLDKLRDQHLSAIQQIARRLMILITGG